MSADASDDGFEDFDQAEDTKKEESEDDWAGTEFEEAQKEPESPLTLKPEPSS